MQPPQRIHAKIVVDNAEARAQQKSCQNEPSFFEIHRVSPAVQPLVQGRPEGAQQGSVPAAPGGADDALQALDNRACSHLVLFAFAGSMIE
jgi:hypothetical protein